MQRVIVLLFLVFAVASRAQPLSDGALKWAFTTLSSSARGAILSSPAQGRDGTIYFGVQVGTTKADASGRVIALSPAGPLQWAVTLPDWVDATPAIAPDGTIYVGCWDGKLRALTPTGALQWEYETGGYIVSSPAVAGDGTVYVGSGDYSLHAVNPDGSRKWVYPTASWVDGSPVVGPDGTIFVGAGDVLYAIGPDGIGRWQAALRGGIVGAPAIAADGTIYVGARDKRLYAFSAAGALRWYFETGDAIEASPVLAEDGTVYAASLDGRVYAIATDGSERWRFPAAGQPALRALYSTPAVRADGSVVFGSSDNAVYAVSGDGTLLWRTPLGDWADSSPLVAEDGTIYIGSYDKKLYALAGTQRAAANSAWPMFKRNAARDSWQWRGLRGAGEGVLANASVRARLAADDASLVVGFYVDGEGGRELLVRGIGPALAQFGIDDVVADPRLRILAQPDRGVLAENSSWGVAPRALEIAQRAHAVGAFPLPEQSRDAAVLRIFPRGGFVAELGSAGRGGGVVLAEIYDTGGADARLGNLSARARSEAGDGVVTAGFVVQGGERTLLIRGVGPGLAKFGVSDALADPKLRVFAGGADPIAENDDWSLAPNAAAAAAATQTVGAFPLDVGGRDAALLVLVRPGAYTVQVTGAQGTSGVALIELFELR